MKIALKRAHLSESPESGEVDSLKRNHHAVSEIYLNGFAYETRQIRINPLTGPNPARKVSSSKALNRQSGPQKFDSAGSGEIGYS
jgi:ribosomal protein L32